MSNIYDCIILGCGIAGATAAYRIATKHKNLKTLLIELSSRPAKRRGIF